MLDGAVLARGIHGLEDNQHRPTVLCIEFFLELGQLLNSGGKAFLRVRFVLGIKVERVSRVEVLESKTPTTGNAKGFDQFSCAVYHAFHFIAPPFLKVIRQKLKQCESIKLS